MVVAPFDSKLDISALVSGTNGPVVLQRYHASNEEIIVLGLYEQSHGIAC